MTAPSVHPDAPRAPELAPGTRVDRYVIEGHLGAGGMGAVYAARRDDLPLRVALKVMNTACGGPEGRRRFAREAETLARLRHPHIVEVFDRGEWEGVPYLVMPLLEGESLGRRFDRLGALPLAALLDVVLPCLAAVATAHDVGVIHRDLKPDNIFLERSPDGVERPRVLDFGVARVEGVAPVAITGTGAVVGTPRYMAPEQLWGARSADARSDQWAFGVILFEGASGRHPFPVDGLPELVLALNTKRAPRVRDVAPALPTAFDDVVARALSHEPDGRFPDLRALGAALLPFAGEVARGTWGPVFGRAPARPSSEVAAPRRPVERPVSVAAVSVSRAPAALSTRPALARWAALAALCGLAALLVLLRRETPREATAPTAPPTALPAAPDAVVPVDAAAYAASDAPASDTVVALDARASTARGARPPRRPARPAAPPAQAADAPPTQTSSAPPPPPPPMGANGAPIRY